jgi:glucosamine kinase
MQKILAIDAGGTSTRAVIADANGHCTGFGLAGGGNPISAGLEAALDSYSAATHRALAASGADERTFSCILIAMAGKSGGLPIDRISDRLESLGVHGPIDLESDLLAMFCSGTPSPQGYALVAGTGSVAARVREHRLERVAGGTGWLLGDDGSGFWIGHRVTRAVVAAIDGLGPETALTNLLLTSLGLERTDERAEGRPAVLLRLLEALYAQRPVELSRFAPLAFQAPGDGVATSILESAASALDNLLATVRHPDVAGPLVLGGSVLVDGMLTEAAPVAWLQSHRFEMAEVNPVRDGVVGAAVLALLRIGVDVDTEVFERISTDVARLREDAVVAGGESA